MSTACDTCGWLAALGGMLAFGSFGVPIKSKVAQSLDIDPLVFQTYKTSMCFITSWLVLLSGQPFTFTPWGIVSGLFWVPGGIGTIYAIQNAGLAIGIGVSSSFIVLVSFTWGIFVFDEHVHSQPAACFAVGCMMLGLLGMSYYSAPTKSSDGRDGVEGRIVDTVHSGEVEPLVGHCTDQSICHNTEDCNYVPIDDEELWNNDQPAEVSTLQEPNLNRDTHIICCSGKWQRRTLGIIVAMCTGTYGGSIMVPMKWAPGNSKGLGYLMSFSIGASLVTLSFWIIRYLSLCQRHRSFSKAYHALPLFHFRKMWIYGSTCGLVWSIGNFFSILSVEYLGEGVGYSVVQSSILVSGLWGIFYFHEIKGAGTISKWIISASVTVVGILLLSHEHHEK